MTRGELRDVDVTLLHQTDDAWLVELEDGREIWVPKSAGQLEKTGGQRDSRYLLTVQTWFAERENMT